MSGSEGEKNDGGQRLHLQGRNTFILMVGGASLCFLISIVIIFYRVYVRFYYNRPRRVQRVRSRTPLRTSRTGRSSHRGEDGSYFFTLAREGLCKQALDALPVFVYNPENFKDGLRCAVCLCEFEEEESGRLLPICNHSFHLECIDMWFSSHSTCPICRASVEKQPDEGLPSPGGTARLDMSVTEEEESSNGAAHPQKGNVNQHGTDDDSSIVVEIGITIHDIPANGK